MEYTQTKKDRTLSGFRSADNLSPGCFEKHLCSEEKRLNDRCELYGNGYKEAQGLRIWRLSDCVMEFIDEHEIESSGSSSIDHTHQSMFLIQVHNYH
jgi:hypothetical protein